MQNLEAFQNIELQKQMAKAQMVRSFQGYLQQALSLSVAQQMILQQAGITQHPINGINGINRSNLLQPNYFDPAMLFGPSLGLLGVNSMQVENRLPNNLLPQNVLSQNRGLLPQVQPPQPIIQQQIQQQPQMTQLLELPPLPLKKFETAEDSEGLTDFFQKKVSNASTKSSMSMRDDEFETGKKIVLEKEIHIQNPGEPTQRARKRTKVICGHPWKSHHAKGLCKNCYETFGKTRKPWRCDHQAHFAKGYCKKCYLKLRQKLSMKELALLTDKVAEKPNTAIENALEMGPNNVKQEAK